MTEIRTRSQLLAWLEDNAPRPCIKRAMLEGTCENLGAFQQTNAQSVCPGWIVKVTRTLAKRPRCWYVAVKPITINGHVHKYRAMEVGDTDFWSYWLGNAAKNILYTGDNPEEYRRLKSNAKTD